MSESKNRRRKNKARRERINANRRALAKATFSGEIGRYEGVSFFTGGKPFDEMLDEMVEARMRRAQYGGRKGCSAQRWLEKWDFE
jgi:hypothetical protein